MVVLQNFIDRLNQYMRESGLTSAALAEKLNCSPPYISYLLSGKRNPSNTFLNNLVKVSGRSATWWLHGKDEYKGLLALNDLLDVLVDHEMITDTEDIDNDNREMIWLMVKAELKNKLIEKKRK